MSGCAIAPKENAGAAIQQYQISESRSRGEVADGFSILRTWRGLRGSFDFNLAVQPLGAAFLCKEDAGLQYPFNRIFHS